MCFFKKKKKCMREEELITLRGKTEDQILFEIYEMYKEMSEFNRRLESRLVRNLDTANTMLRELDRARDTMGMGMGMRKIIILSLHHLRRKRQRSRSVAKFGLILSN